MPYIRQEDRDRLDPFIKGLTAHTEGGSMLGIKSPGGGYLRSLLGHVVGGFLKVQCWYPGDACNIEYRAIRTTGELNYVVTRLVLQYILGQGLSYATLATAVGVVEYVMEGSRDLSTTGTLRLVVLEIQRRIVGAYEDVKIAENGDVPEFKALAEVEIAKAMAKAHVLPELPPWDINAPLRGGIQEGG